MNKSRFFHRYMVLYSALQNLAPGEVFTKNELQVRIQQKLENRDMEKQKISHRTIERDIQEMRNEYGIQIEFDRKHMGYYIANNQNTSNFEKLIESYDFFQVFSKFSKDSNDFVPEKRCNQNYSHMAIVLEQIRDKKLVEIHHENFKKKELQIRTIEPYFLKEFKQRWYVIGLDVSKKEIRCFAFDRIQTVQKLAVKSSNSLLEDSKRLYDNSFGVISPNDIKIPTIEIAFTKTQSDYIITTPLHKSQTQIAETETHLHFELHMFITYDFIMELMSYGRSVRVIKPQWLIDTLKEQYTDALNQYK